MRTIIAATALTFSVLTAQSAVAQDISGAGANLPQYTLRTVAV